MQPFWGYYSMQNRSALKKANSNIGSLLAILGIFLVQTGYAQRTLINADPYQRFLEARQWFKQENYQVAYPVFKELEQNLTPQAASTQEVYVETLHFYQLACELMEGNEAAEPKAQAYMASNATTDNKAQLGYYLGSYYFKQQEYLKAAEAFSQASVTHLTNKQVAAMQFQHGYSLFVQKQFNQAKPLFNSVRQMPESDYYADANYYYGLIAFSEQQYREALGAFDVAAKYARYQPLVPYYNASIKYATGQKEAGMADAEKALKQGNQFYTTELKQLLGHAHFGKGEYNKALPLLQEYVAASQKVKREDLYELAYCYYIGGQYAKAIEQFKPLAGGQDSISHHAMYLLGDAYLKTNQKANARNAFLFCSTNGSHALYQEISLFQYGKLSYEQGFDNDALGALKEYVNKYPRGQYQAEARDLLVGVLANTSNYKEALELYNSLPSKSELAQRQYPRIVYNRAQQLLNDGNLDEANRLLDQALNARYNEAVKPLAHFWKGEIAYQKGQFAPAVQQLTSYLRQPISSGETTPDNARYTLGYSLIELQQYSDAEKEFAQLANRPIADKELMQDIMLRLADCYFMQKNFTKATPLYNRVAAERGFGADYAIYQAGIIAGAQNRPADKVASLRSLESLYPQSALTTQAFMEIADTYLATEKFREAIPWLEKITNGKGGESLKPEALLKTGLAYYNLNSNTEALAKFRSLVKQYPTTPEAELAITNVRSIYVEQGKPELYVSFLQEAGRSIDGNTADSLTYVAIELQLADGRKEAAYTSLKNYISKYPNGRYALEANYQAAELARERKEMKAALGYYDFVATRAPNKYAEQSLLQLSRAYYFDDKNYPQAAKYYALLRTYATSNANKLEAMRGLLRSQYFLKDYAAAEGTARELLTQGGIGTDDKIFANLALGKQARQTGNCQAAIGYFKQVINLSKSEPGAEARYEEAACLYESNKLTESEKAAFELIKKSGSYEWWVTKAYLLLGDIYLKQQDYFNAKATYKSVAENAGIAELKQEAREKLAQAEKQEAAQSKIGG